MLDDNSKYSIVTFHKTKDTVPIDTITKLERYENLTGNKIGKVFGDNAKEYICTEFTAWCKSKGITQEFTVPGNLSTNGAAERLDRTLHDISTALLLTSKFPNMYWAEMVKSANIIRNLSPSRDSDKTPYEMFYGTKPKVDHLRIFGCTAYVHVPVKSREFKFAPSQDSIYPQISAQVQQAHSEQVHENNPTEHEQQHEHEILPPQPNIMSESDQPNPPLSTDPILDITPPDPLRKSDRATRKPDFLSCLAASDVPFPRNEKEALSNEYSE
eukprot:gene22873-biopygen31503